jgi:hypothetical protein
MHLGINHTNLWETSFCRTKPENARIPGVCKYFQAEGWRKTDRYMYDLFPDASLAYAGHRFKNDE